MSVCPPGEFCLNTSGKHSPSLAWTRRMHAAAGRAEVRIMETLPIRNRRLLVIDERQADRDRVCGLLQGTLGAESPPVAPERGYQVDTAGSAEEALGRIRSALQADAPYAVVFLGMPSVGADIPVLERFWRLDSRLQVVVHAPPADFPLLAPWAAEERLLLLGLPLQGQEVRQMAGNLSAKWNVTAHLQLQMSRMEAAIQEITGKSARPRRRWRKRSASARNWKANWCRRRSLPRSATWPPASPMRSITPSATFLQLHHPGGARQAFAGGT